MKTKIQRNSENAVIISIACVIAFLITIVSLDVPDGFYVLTYLFLVGVVFLEFTYEKEERPQIGYTMLIILLMVITPLVEVFHELYLTEEPSFFETIKDMSGYANYSWFAFLGVGGYIIWCIVIPAVLTVLTLRSRKDYPEASAE